MNIPMPWHLEQDNEYALDASMYQSGCEFDEAICGEFDVAFGAPDDSVKLCPYHYFTFNKFNQPDPDQYTIVINRNL